MIRFGPSGNDDAFYDSTSWNFPGGEEFLGGRKKPTSIDAPKWLSAMGLTAYEINFTRGVRLSESTAQKIGDQARAHGITVSGHAPYYINLARDITSTNLASNKTTSFDQNLRYIASSLEILRAIGAPDDNGKYRLVVHIGSQCDLSRERALKNCVENLAKIVARLRTEMSTPHDTGLLTDNNRAKTDPFPFLLCIETMGRFKQIGDYREICEICAVDDCVVPCIDFGHINCLEQGSLRTNPNRIGEIMDYMRAELGDKMRYPHIHFSAIIYTEKGEHAHTNLDDNKWNFPFEPLAQYIRAHNLEPIIISESKKNQARDAARLSRDYMRANT